MAYLNEDGLARYDGLIKNWVTFKSGTVDGIDPLLNWQKTETAGAVSFYPLPAAPLDPVVNFQFTETGPASGDKAPDNPSTITGVSQAKVTRCGKNLLPPIQSSQSETVDGVTFTVNEDGSVLVNGTATQDVVFTFFRYGDNKNIFLHGIGCILSGCTAGGSADTYNLYMQVRRPDGVVVGSYRDYGSGVTYNPSSERLISFCGISISNGYTASNLLFKPQIEFGLTATDYEPPAGNAYTVNLGGTYYGGSVDVSTGVMTVTWKGVVFTGAENFTSEYSLSAGVYQYGFALSEYSKAYSDSYMKCSHFTFGSTAAGQFYVRNTGGGGIRFYSDISTVQGFKDFLASQYANGTPVTVVYESLNSATVPLTPLQIYSLSQLDPYTPRTNTVYSDQVSVQAGYPKSPQVTSTELTNAIVSLGGNI